MTITEAVAEFESLQDLKNPPTTWTQAMEAVTAGAIDYDEVEPLCGRCAEIADEAIRRLALKEQEPGFVDVTPLWSACLGDMLPAVSKSARSGKPLGAMAGQFAAMGRAADWVEAGFPGKN